MKSLHHILILTLAAFLLIPAFGTAQNLVEELNSTENVSRFAEAVQSSDLAEILSSSGPYTIFAPTDEAIENEFGSGSVSMKR